MNSVTPAAISDVKSESSVKDEPKLDVELGSEGEGTCFDVLDVVEESFDEVPTNYFSSEDDEANKVYSSGDSSSESGSPCQKMETAADGQSTAVEDDVDMEEVFETIDGDPDDYEECYVFERPPSPSDSPLPRGWKQVYHESGATIYVHVETNVCSLSRPYFLGPKSTKRHNVPTTPIPCLYYRSLQPSGNENLPAVAFDSSACEGNEASCPAEETASSSCADTCPAQSVIPTANSATTDANVTALEANATISNLNPITCPLNESSHAESAVTSDAEVANLGQNLATSDLILRNMNVATHYPKTGTLHTEVTVSDTNCHTCPMRAATYVENTNLATFSANPAVSSLDTTTSTSAPVTSTSSFSTDAAASTSTASPAAMHVTEPAFPNVTASTSSAIPSNEDEIFDTSCIADNAAMVADELPGDESGLLEYYKRLFKFKTIKYLKFHSWDVRRTYLRALRNERNRRRGPFSKNKFVSFPIETKDDEGNVVSTKKWIINPCGRNYVALLHEYLQQSKKAQPEYKFTEVDNARNPYAATVVVNETEYGTGFGMSKKEAKFEAAKATLEVSASITNVDTHIEARLFDIFKMQFSFIFKVLCKKIKIKE